MDGYRLQTADAIFSRSPPSLHIHHNLRLLIQLSFLLIARPMPFVATAIGARRPLQPVNRIKFQRPFVLLNLVLKCWNTRLYDTLAYHPLFVGRVACTQRIRYGRLTCAQKLTGWPF